MSHAELTMRDELQRLGRLPSWLTAGADGARVAAELTAVVSELGGGGWTIEECNPKLRVKEGAGWAASYRLTVLDPGGVAHVVDLTGTYDPAVATASEAATVDGVWPTPSWSVSLPAMGLWLRVRETDVALPALADLTDPALATVLLEQALQERWPGTAIASCTPEVMRYKPGSRCTVRYRLGYAPGDQGPETLVAKTYRGSKGDNAFRGMTALDRAGIPADVVRLAPALAYRDDLKVLVQGAVPEEATLKQLAHEVGRSADASALAGLRAGVVQAARGLAALHASGVEHGEVVTWDDEAQEATSDMERLAMLAPETEGAADQYLQVLRALAAEHPADPLGPAHRSFRPAQVLLAGGGISFIDFDGLCTAEPAIDVALFRAALRDAALRMAPPAAVDDRIALIDDVCAEFLTAYEEVAPITRARVAAWEGVYLLTFVLHCWTKVRPARIDARLRILLAHLELVDREFSLSSGSR